MSQLSKLIQVTDEEKERILKEHNMTQKDLNDSVEVLKTWILQYDNVIEDLGESALTENQLTSALLNAKMSLEKAKRVVEGYFTCKTLYNDFFKTMVPEERFNKNCKLVKSVIMPRLLPNLSRLHVIKFLDFDAEAESGLDYYYLAIMIAEMRMLEDFFLSTSILIDMKGFGLRNLLKFTPTVNYTLVHLLTALSVRIGYIHIYNAPPIWERINSLLKAIMPTKILSKIKVHNSIEDIQASIPKEYLPSDFGGTEKSVDELHDMWVKALIDNEETLRKLTRLRAKEVNKPQQLSGDLGMGVDGSFKKLEID